MRNCVHLLVFSVLTVIHSGCNFKSHHADLILHNAVGLVCDGSPLKVSRIAIAIENGKIVYYIRSDKTGKISKRFNNQLFAPTDISDYFHREYNERRKTTPKNMFNFMR